MWVLRLGWVGLGMNGHSFHHLTPGLFLVLSKQTNSTRSHTQAGVWCALLAQAAKTQTEDLYVFEEMMLLGACVCTYVCVCVHNTTRSSLNRNTPLHHLQL